MTPHYLQLHRDAPAKPPCGAPCNGCGVCCAAALCPVAQVVFFRQRPQPPCPALHWQVQQQRYVCGLLRQPRHYLPWLPGWLEAPAQRLFHRSIAAGQGCDCDIDIEVA
ncbi:MAG: hypothetical protein KUL75_10005 [Sterolibacterium sp.]|nr:hypothetical protein [Sterolibacterium sp.]